MRCFDRHASTCAKRWPAHALYRLFFAVTGFLLFLSTAAHGLDLHPEDKRLDVGQLEYLIAEPPADLDDIRRLPARAWQSERGEVNFGYTQEVHWFKFNLQALKPQHRILQIAYPLLDNIEVYHLDEGGLQETYRSGDSLTFDSRPIDNRHFLFPLDFAADSQNTIFVRIQTAGALRVPLIIWNQQSFFAEDGKASALNAMYIGMLLIMAAFNLLLYFSLRDITYLYYVFFVSTIALLMVGISGYGFQMLYPGSPKLHSLLILLAVPTTQIAVCLFTIKFFKFSTTSRLWYRIFQGFIAVNIFCFLGGLVFSYEVSTRISVLVTLPISVGAAIAGIKFWSKGDAGAHWFSLAWIFFLLDVMGLVLSRLGVIPASFLIEQGLPLSTISQALLFALAMASRFNAERDGRLRAQQEHLFEIRKRREAEKQLIYAAGHNETSGLPNRLLFEKTLRQHLDCPPDNRSCVTIVLLHVRRFDDVNKTLGHRNADVLLRRIGERIDAVVSQWPDALPLNENGEQKIYTAHIEGVSFCFTLASTDRDGIVQDIESLIKNISTPMEFLGLALDLSFIVGCSFAGKENDSVEDQYDPQTLLRQAFIAFDAASKNLTPIAVYEPTMNPYSPKRLTLMTELRAALSENNLRLFFQPQLNLRTGNISGFEALLRWRHEDYGYVSPDEFIPMAEKTGLMKPLTMWVLERAIAFIKQLDISGDELTVSVNISVLNLREPDFCQHTAELLERAGVNPSRLILEVTETAAMIDPEHAVNALSRLHQAGVRLSIDDFGTGHSSLAYIRKLPVHEIKIDRSFVSEMDTNKNDATIVKTTLNMCHDLGYEVVAEGVENQAVETILSQMGCDIIQGYYLAKPMCEADTLAWIAERVSKRNAS